MSLQQHCGWIFHRLLTFSGQQYKKKGFSALKRVE
jgi:hypothetical protein